MRIGHGFDAHRFAENIPLMLGGIQVPHRHGLDGHSDGDAVIHALCDALLGALALGSIGEHFPSHDDANKNRDSKNFLIEIYKLVQESNFSICNIDITIIAQAPKLVPHIPLMRKTIGEILSIEIGKISIKATTTDRMGSIGRGEGLAAHALVVLQP